MRVMCFCSGFIDYTIQLSNALSKTETVMLSLPKQLTLDHVETIDREVILRLFTYKGIRCPKIIETLYEIYTYIRKFKPDVIHIQGSTEPLFWLFIFLRKYPLVTSFHDPKRHIGEQGLIPELKMFLSRKFSTKIIVHSKLLKGILIKEYSVPRDKIFVTSFGEHEVVPFKKYERNDLKEDGNLILFFGRIWEYKGLEFLIKAEPLITKEVPDAKIVIAGKGENFKKYEEMMINKDSFITYNYRIPYKEGAELFQRCSVVVLPYIEASQSGVIPTAYGFKKPLVVTNVGAIPEIVDDGVTGFIVSPRDEKALAEAIVKLLKDEDLRREMGENAYKKLKTDLSWNNIAEETIEVYKEAINEYKNRWRR